MNKSAFTMEKFLQYLITLQKDYKRLSELLKKKQEAILVYDIETLDEIMKDEQAYVLLSRGFNHNIEGFRESLGLSGITLSEMIASMPDEWRPQFEEIFGPLRQTMEDVRRSNEECQSVIEKKLAQIRTRLEDFEGTPNKTYGNARPAPAPKTMNVKFDKSV
jgi:hypothetical protein